ncbi:MAG: extracellular solute-binding protein [Microbacterium sp.]
MSSRSLAGVALLSLSALVLAGCAASSTADSAEEYDPDAEVTISVGGMPTSDQPEQLEAFNESVAAFEELYPNITIEGSEVKWDAQTFAAQLAGGTLPTTLSVAYTDIGGLIENGQVADVTDYLDDDPSLAIADLNDSVLSVAQDDAGRVYGVPTDVYSMVVFYNRDLYEQAGLDPDTPPSTWEEVRENAQAIAEATGVKGFGIATTENYGGWVLAAMSYGFGDTLETTDDDGTVTANIDNDATQSALQLLSDMQWEDGTYATNVLAEYDDVVQEFAAGEIGQYIGMGSDYSFNKAVTTNGMDADDIGMGVLPQSDDGIGTLSGGAVQIVSPDATPNQIAAALKWVNYYKYQIYYDEDAAVTAAQTTSAAGKIVGAPGTPLVAEETYDQYLEWIADYINIDRSHFDVFEQTRDSIPVLPEPTVAAQEIYATLDSVIQSVLTDEDADIPSLLESAQSQAESLIASAQE